MKVKYRGKHAMHSSTQLRRVAKLDLQYYRGPQSDKSPYFFSSARNFPNFWRTITLAYYHYNQWGTLRKHYYRATLPFIDTISHTSILFSAFKNPGTDRGPFPQFQQH